MKIIESKAGALSNFEVLDLLRSRGAGTDPTRVIASVSPSEFKVFDYLEASPAGNQTRETVCKIVDLCKKYDLAQAEILNILNLRPASPVEICQIVEEFDMRFDEEKIEKLVETIAQILPPPLPQVEESKGGTGDGSKETDEAAT